MPLAVMKADCFAQCLAVRAVDPFEATGLLQQRDQFGNEAGAIAWMRSDRALPMLRTDHEARVGKQQACWSAFLPRREQAASMVEMQMAENDHVDVFMNNAKASQIYRKSTRLTSSHKCSTCLLSSA